MHEHRRHAVVAIALDSMDVELIRRGIDEGWLPTIASIVGRGRSGTLGGMQAYVPGASWPSTVTSTGMSDHRIVLDRQLRPGTYEIERVSFRSFRRPPFWADLAAAGSRTTVAGLYSAPLLSPFAGTQLVGWGAHDPYSMWRVHAEPPEVLRQVTDEIGERDVADDGPFRTHEDHRRNLTKALHGVRQQARGVRYLLRHTTWDLFLAGLNEAHSAGHRLWHYQDVDHPAHDASAPEDLRTSLVRLYREIDAVLAHVLEDVPDDLPLVLFSPQGMEANHLLGDPLPRLLELGGWLVQRRASESTARVRAYAAFRTAVQRTVPRPIRRAIGRRLPTDLLLTQISLRGIDPSRTRAFPLPGDGTSFVRLNVVGRDPAGTVTPGADYDRLCEELSAELLALVNPDLGRPAVVECVRTDALTGAPVEDILPDLIVRWDLRRPIRRVRSPRLGTVRVPQLDTRTGQHRPTGWIIGTGPGIEPGGEPLAEPLGRIEDVGPTILALLGLRPFDGVTGSPIAGIAP